MVSHLFESNFNKLFTIVLSSVLFPNRHDLGDDDGDARDVDRQAQHPLSFLQPPQRQMQPQCCIHVSVGRRNMVGGYSTSER
eukprot:UN00856